MQKLDQKQKTQVVILGVLAVGMFGTFIFRMLQVSPAAAHTQTAGAAGQQTTLTTARVTPASTKAAGDVVLGSTDAPAPTSTMRDPFVPGIADEAALEAYRKSIEQAKPAPHVAAASGSWNKPSALPTVNPLPRPNGSLTLPTVRTADYTVAPLPTAPAAAETPAPAWTVTGLVQGDDGRMAILRSGESRRMVRTGDMVDDNYRVVEISRGRVVVAHGKSTFTLPLGGVKTAPAPAATPVQATPQANTPQDLGAPASTPAATSIDPNAVIRLPGGLTLPTIHLPAN